MDSYQKGINLTRSNSSKTSTFGKLVIVGTVAAVCAVASFMIANQSYTSVSSGVNFLSGQLNSEVEQAFI